MIYIFMYFFYINVELMLLNNIIIVLYSIYRFIIVLSCNVGLYNLYFQVVGLMVILGVGDLIMESGVLQYMFKFCVNLDVYDILIVMKNIEEF